MSEGDDESPPCLRFGRNPAQFVVVGSVPIRELGSVNVLADEPIVDYFMACRLQERSSRTSAEEASAEFNAGEECQHDTSPHVVEVASKKHKHKPPPSCCVTRIFCSFKSISPSPASTVRSFSPRPCGFWQGARPRDDRQHTHVVVLHGTGSPGKDCAIEANDSVAVPLALATTEYVAIS